MMFRSRIKSMNKKVAAVSILLLIATAIIGILVSTIPFKQYSYYSKSKEVVEGILENKINDNYIKETFPSIIEKPYSCKYIEDNNDSYYIITSYFYKGDTKERYTVTWRHNKFQDEDVLISVEFDTSSYSYTKQ